MKAEDLRIGNFVYYYDGAYFVTDINPPYINLLSGDRMRVCDVDEDVLQPITITEELLQKNGFKIDEDIVGYIRLYNELARVAAYETYNGKWHIHIDDEEYSTCFSKNLKYVHELQNAYYIATGNELKINLL